MDSANSMRPLVALPQSTERRQRKRPRIGMQSPSMPSQESDMDNSSCQTEVGSTSQEAYEKSMGSIPQAPSQATPPVPETKQRRPNLNRQQKEKKRKTKSIQEIIQEMHEQNCVYMEKKFYMRREYQKEKLQILRERSETLFALETRRLDLEFMRMEQQLEWRREQMEWRREESRIRELAFQVELEKLRSNF